MRDWRVYVVFVAAVGFALVAGLAYVTVALVGGAAVAGLLVLTRLDPRPDPGFDRPTFDRRHGARGEVQELAWAMVARDGRVSERMLRRVREVATARLARHGLDLADPADESAIQELVGSKAFRTLTRTRSPRPKMSEVRQAVDALERIGTTRKSGDT
ncbi:hypothetical protein [Cellulomonas sp. URHE0023]|uniref:hypothetical protein n=1 Tax=Cellulomonas sp. URHE0023 TaxID=1380354 RepID=UPI00048517BE|nr:hypothetical protein [Cellulomonas sp. URHE0023]